ncbi:MAG TPA: hypothetical protein VII55_01905 [Candidatus Saccharimonadales bacterium]
MAIATFDTRDVQITSVSFRADAGQRRFKSFPRRLVYQGREYILAEA